MLGLARQAIDGVLAEGPLVLFCGMLQGDQSCDAVLGDPENRTGAGVMRSRHIVCHGESLNTVFYYANSCCDPRTYVTCAHHGKGGQLGPRSAAKTFVGIYVRLLDAAETPKLSAMFKVRAPVNPYLSHRTWTACLRRAWSSKPGTYLQAAVPHRNDLNRVWGYIAL